MAVLSDLGDCNRGQDMVQEILAGTSGMEPAQIEGLDAATNSDHSTILWVGAGG